MGYILRRLETLMCVCIVLSACGTARSSGPRAASRHVIEHAEIQRTLHGDAYSLLQDLRPHWLQGRVGSLGSRSEVRVYLGELHLGGIASLRQIPTSTIEAIWHFDGPAATQRWGTDHAAGVIQIVSRSQGSQPASVIAPRLRAPDP